MDDIEAYGQLAEHPFPTTPAPAAPPTRRQRGAAPLPEPVAAPVPKRRRSHWLRNIILLAFAYVALALFTMVQPIAVPSTGIKLAVPFPGGTSLVFGLPDRPYNVLVIGLDRRPSETGPSRTDTVLVVHIDPHAHTAAFLSIPRDALMEVPMPDGSYTNDRINTAYVYNWSSKDGSAAPKALMRTIEHNLGITIDHYLTWDQYGAEKMIDAMGGVDIDNPRAFGQADYSDDDVHVVPQQFAQGKLHLDGYQAVAYGRIRQGSTDFDRIQRQQRVASGLIAKASNPLSLLRVPALLKAYRGAIDTDMSLRQSAGVLAMLKRVPDGDLKTKSLGDAAVSCTSCSASIQLLDPAKTEAIIAEAFGDKRAGARAAELLAAAGVTP